MFWLRSLVLLLVATLIQVTVVHAIQIRSARPDLPLIMVLWLVSRLSSDRDARWRAFWLGWLAGLLVDIYSAGSALPFGSAALAFGLAGAAVSRLGPGLFVGSVIAQALVTGVAALAVHVALAIVLRIAAAAPLHVLIAHALGRAAYTGLFAPVVFLALGLGARLLRLRTHRSAPRA